MSSDRSSDAAFEDFVTASGRDLGRLAWVLTLDHEEAAELVQEALARTYARWSAIWTNGGDDPFPYVRRMLVNLRTDRWRTRRRRKDAETLWSARPEQALSNGQDLHAFDVEQGSLHTALATLTHRQRQAVALRYLEDLSVEETASVLGISRAAVKMATGRGLDQLRAALEGVER